MRIAERVTLAAMVAAAALISVADARTWRVAPGPEAQTELQHAFANVEPGDTVRLDRGRYELTAGLTLSVRGVEVRGEGQDRTVLSFAGQQGTGAGLTVSGPGAVLRDFAVEDTRGDGVAARDCEGVTMRGLRAEWTRPVGMAPTAHGLHVANCSNVLVEQSIARGASGAGIEVASARNAIVRANTAERNGIGLAIANGVSVDVIQNVARGNATGIAVVNVPGLPHSDGHSVRVFDNVIADNAPGASANSIAAGAGVFVMAARNVHVFNNEIGASGTANVIIAGYGGNSEDRAYIPLPRDVMIRNNRFGASGGAPSGDFAALAQSEGGALADVIWDGADTYYAASGPRTSLPRIVMRDNRAASGGIGSFLSLGLNVAGSPLSEAAPNRAYPPLLDLAEPERVRIEN